MTDFNLNYKPSEVNWLRFGMLDYVYLVGKDYVLINAGSYLLVHDVTTKEENILRANDNVWGQGIGAVGGHKTLKVFAYSEAVDNTKMFVRTCPDFQQINVMRSKVSKYLSIAFTETEFLVGLTGFPDCELLIYKWRTGELTKVVQTHLIYSEQKLRANYGSQAVVTQAPDGISYIYLWKILLCGKKCFVNRHNVTYRNQENSNVISSSVWTTEGGLFVIDCIGHVYVLASDNFLDRIITWENEGDCMSHICWFRNGLGVVGSDNQFKHFTKESGNWECDWTTTPKYKFKMLKVLTNKDILLATSDVDDVLLYDDTQQTFNLLRSDDSRLDEICLIYPKGEYIVTLAHHTKLNLRKVSDGKTLDKKQYFNKEAVRIAANPVYPYFAVGFSDGTMEVYVCLNNEMKLIWFFQLCRIAINKIAYAEEGSLMMAANVNVGRFFIIESTLGEKFKIISTVLANKQVADFILVGTRACLRLFVIFVTSDIFIAGNNIHRYCIVKNKEPILKKYELENPNRMYGKLYVSLNHAVRDRRFYAVPLDNKNLHELEAKRGDTHVRIVDRIKSNHMMKHIRYHWSSGHAISYGYDGLVIIRTENLKHITGVLMVHHRRNYGIKVAYLDPLGKHILSLGYDGVLLCTKLTDVEDNPKKSKDIEFAQFECREKFAKQHVGTTPYGIYEGKSWLEYKELQKINAEKVKYEAERSRILKGIEKIRERATTLLTKNLEGPENEYLDVQDFNLDLASREEKIRSSKELCERTKIFLEKLIAENNRVAGLIKANFWDKMSEQTRKMWAIFGDFDVDSYGILPVDVEGEERLRRIEEYRRLEEMLAKNDIFQPWKFTSTAEVKDHVKKKPTIYQSDIKVQIDMEEEDLDDLPESKKAEMLEKKQAELENYTAYQGVTSHLYVDPFPFRYLQFDLQCFSQHIIEYNIARNEQNNLRAYFNKQFENIMQLKIREMSTIIEKNSSLRYFLSEYNYFSSEKRDAEIVDPEWKQNEIPEKITIVENEEVGILPYISPSEQAIIDAKAAEAERLRLLRLADDFKERALMAMMNGVLEIRWEDELRKEVPEPKCLLEKDPEEFNEEDLRAMKDYEEKVAFLKGERERYKNILMTDYKKTSNQVREGIRKFNERLQELLNLKFQIEAALAQESLRMHRLRNWDIYRNHIDAEIKQATLAVEENLTKADEIQKLTATLPDYIVEIKNNLEIATTKDKHLDKQFKRDFQDITPTQMEILAKLYRKRPKVNIKTVTLVSIINEMAHCIITGAKSLILTGEALEYCKSLEQMDKYLGIPTPVEPPLFQAMCKIRRMKIESELKCRALVLELGETEATISYFHKSVQTAKENSQKLSHNVTALRNKKLDTVINMDVQLVIREGYVEIPRTGYKEDFEDSVLLSRKTVEEVNEVVIEAGRQKLKAMKNAMAFKREIEMIEWEHKKKKMEIADLKTYLLDISKVKLNKELMALLKSKQRGDNIDKTLMVDVEIELLKKRHRAVLEARKLQIAEVDLRLKEISADNHRLNREIAEVNLDNNELKMDIDDSLLVENKRLIDLKMAGFKKRSKMITQIQANHQEILVLQAELELLRLKSVPVLEYKVDV